MKKIPYVILIIAILVVVGVYFYQRTAKPAQAPVMDTSKTASSTLEGKTATTTSVQEPAKATSTQPKTLPSQGNQSQGTFSSGEGDSTEPNIQVLEVDFDGSAFTPASISINPGDWIFFKNISKEDMWVASDPHPTHTDYPAFDSKKAVAPGSQFKFQFTKAGTWGYHDHFNPAIEGTVVVGK